MGVRGAAGGQIETGANEGVKASGWWWLVGGMAWVIWGQSGWGERPSAGADWYGGERGAKWGWPGPAGGSGRLICGPLCARSVFPRVLAFQSHFPLAPTAASRPVSGRGRCSGRRRAGERRGEKGGGCGCEMRGPKDKALSPPVLRQRRRTLGGQFVKVLKVLEGGEWGI